MTIKNVICDIDGVLMHDNVAVPGAAEFLTGVMEKGLPLVLLTNYPSQTGQDLANRFATAGVNVPDSVFYTSAMATADFLRRQPGFIAASGDDRHRGGDITIQPDARIQQAQPFGAKTLDKNLHRQRDGNEIIFETVAEDRRQLLNAELGGGNGGKLHTFLPEAAMLR